MGKCRGNTTGTVVGLFGTVLILTQKIIKFDMETFDLVSEYCTWPNP